MHWPRKKGVGFSSFYFSIPFWVLHLCILKDKRRGYIKTTLTIFPQGVWTIIFSSWLTNKTKLRSSLDSRGGITIPTHKKNDILPSILKKSLWRHGSKAGWLHFYGHLILYPLTCGLTSNPSFSIKIRLPQLKRKKRKRKATLQRILEKEGRIFPNHFFGKISPLVFCHLAPSSRLTNLSLGKIYKISELFAKIPVRVGGQSEI